jgi:hypothetical protein
MLALLHFYKKPQQPATARLNYHGRAALSTEHINRKSRIREAVQTTFNILNRTDAANQG